MFNWIDNFMEIFGFYRVEDEEAALKEFIKNRACEIVEDAGAVAHSIDKDGRRRGYDCIGIAAVFSNIVSAYLGDPPPFPVEECYFLDNAVNSGYNMLGMWDLNKGEWRTDDPPQPGDLIVWHKKGASDHGHVVVCIDENRFLSGTTNGKPRLLVAPWKDVDLKYKSIYKNSGQVLRWI